MTPELEDRLKSLEERWTDEGISDIHMGILVSAAQLHIAELIAKVRELDNDLTQRE